MSGGTLTGVPGPETAGDGERARLLTLLAEQCAKYTGGESSSLPGETVGELLRSLLYTLSLSRPGGTQEPFPLPEGELWAAVEQGRRHLSDKMARAKRLWGAVCTTAPQIPNDYYADTLRGLGDYLRHYDRLYFAHLAPGCIDYPLIDPPPESLPGISFAEAYLTSLLTENLLLAPFDPAKVSALAGRSSQVVKGRYLNLCQQPLINGLGRRALGMSALPLTLTDEARAELGKLLTEGDREAVLRRAGDELCRELGREDEPTYRCLAALRRSLLPRLASALAAGDLSFVFPSPE